MTELHTPQKPPVAEKKTPIKVMPRTTTPTTPAVAPVAPAVAAAVPSETVVEKKTVTTSPNGGENKGVTPEVVKSAPALVVASTAVKTEPTRPQTAPHAAPARPPLTAGARSHTPMSPHTSQRRLEKSAMHVVSATPKARVSSTSVGDLRSILAKIAQAPDSTDISQKGSNRGKFTTEPAKPAPGAISPLKDALAALHSVSATPDRVLPPRPVKPVDVPKLHAMTASNQAELAAMTAEAEADFATIMASAVPTPTAAPVTAPIAPISSQITGTNPLDPKQVAKLLKSTGHQKTPF